MRRVRGSCRASREGCLARTCAASSSRSRAPSPNARCKPSSRSSPSTPPPARTSPPPYTRCDCEACSPFRSSRAARRWVSSTSTIACGAARSVRARSRGCACSRRRNGLRASWAADPPLSSSDCFARCGRWPARRWKKERPSISPVFLPVLAVRSERRHCSTHCRHASSSSGSGWVAAPFSANRERH